MRECCRFWEDDVVLNRVCVLPRPWNALAKHKCFVTFSRSWRRLRRRCENDDFYKICKTPSVLNDFGLQRKDKLKNKQKMRVWERFILEHIEPSSPHLDRSRCDLGVNAALSSKNTLLCSRLLVFLKSALRRGRKPCENRCGLTILKKSTTLQPFARFAMIRRSEAPAAATSGLEKAYHSAAVCWFSIYLGTCWAILSVSWPIASPSWWECRVVCTNPATNPNSGGSG